MHLNARVLTTASLYLSVHAQWLQSRDIYGYPDAELNGRSIEDFDGLIPRSYYAYDDISDIDFHARSLGFEEASLYSREAGSTGSKPASAGKSDAKPAGKSEAKSVDKGEVKSAGKGEAKSAEKGESKSAASGDSKSAGKSGASASKKFTLSAEQKAKFAAKYGGAEGGKWTQDPKTHKRYFTNADGQKMRFRKDPVTGKLSVARVRSRTGESTSSKTSSAASSDSEGSSLASGSSGKKGGASGAGVAAAAAAGADSKMKPDSKAEDSKHGKSGSALAARSLEVLSARSYLDDDDDDNLAVRDAEAYDDFEDALEARGLYLDDLDDLGF